jgi:uncharacterized protein YpmB
MKELTMKGILICLSIFLLTLGYSSSIYSAEGSNENKTKNEMNKSSMTVQELPQEVKKSLEGRCPVQDAKSVRKETYKGETAYEVTCEKNGRTSYILITKYGKIVREESSRYEQNERQQGESK